MLLTKQNMSEIKKHEEDHDKNEEHEEHHN